MVAIRSTWPGLWVEQYGLGLAVITLGPGGGVAVEPGGNVTRVPGFPTKVVDTVGAGDTFMAGFLDARVKLELEPGGVLGTRRRRRVDRLLPTGSAAADLGRGRRPDRRADLTSTIRLNGQLGAAAPDAAGMPAAAVSASTAS